MSPPAPTGFSLPPPLCRWYTLLLSQDMVGANNVKRNKKIKKHKIYVSLNRLGKCSEISTNLALIYGTKN